MSLRLCAMDVRNADHGAGDVCPAYAGMRGLGHVFRAVGNLPQYERQRRADASEGWAARPQRFKRGWISRRAKGLDAILPNLPMVRENIGYLRNPSSSAENHRNCEGEPRNGGASATCRSNFAP